MGRNRNGSADNDIEEMKGIKAFEGEVVLRKGDNVSLVTQEMRAQGAALFETMLMALKQRDLNEVETKDLLKMTIQLLGMFVPKAKEEQAKEPMEVTGSQIMDVLKSCMGQGNKQ